MKMTNLSGSIAAALIAFATAAVVPSFAQTVTIPVPASSVDNGDRATIGINLTPLQTDITNVTNEIAPYVPYLPNLVNPPAGATGSFATAPGAAVAITNFYIRDPYPGYYTTITTTDLYDPSVTAEGGEEQEPVGACVYGMGNTVVYNGDGVDGRAGPGLSSQATIQCPSGSGWLTVGYEIAYGPVGSQTGGP